MHLTITADELKPFIDAALAEMLARFGIQDRIAYSEVEAAALLGIRSHVLRDARLRGEIVGAKLGRGYSYTRADLIEYVERRKRPNTE
ncbi:MAG: helix-turn-helix domain-containing protein [Planctomycetes bacterium]|nr:helix-turn-helix domain-containing protein [Planctomycetota bacterium]